MDSISRNFFELCYANFWNFPKIHSMFDVNLRQIFFFRDGTGSVPNGATINYRKRISSFQARTSFPTFFNFSPFFFFFFILILFHPHSREFSESLSVHLSLTFF